MIVHLVVLGNDVYKKRQNLLYNLINDRNLLNIEQFTENMHKLSVLK